MIKSLFFVVSAIGAFLRFALVGMALLASSFSLAEASEAEAKPSAALVAAVSEAMLPYDAATLDAFIVADCLVREQGAGIMRLGVCVEDEGATSVPFEALERVIAERDSVAASVMRREGLGMMLILGLVGVFWLALYAAKARTQ